MIKTNNISSLSLLFNYSLKRLTFSIMLKSVKLYLLIVLVLLSNISLCGQTKLSKPLINDTTYKCWTSVEDDNISADGKYAYYQITNEPIGENTWVILSTDRKFEFRSTKYSNLNFANNSRFLYAIQGDSLVKMQLNNKTITYVPKCKGYELYSKGKLDWLIYSLDDLSKSLIIEDLNTGRKQVFTGVDEYELNKNGAVIFSKRKTDSLGTEDLRKIELGTGIVKTIYKGLFTRNLIYDLSGIRMAFGVFDRAGNTQIWYYERDHNTAKCLVNDSTPGIAENLKITLDETWRFSEDGKDLFFNLTPKTVQLPDKANGPVIWNYKDLYLLSQYKKIFASKNRGENLSILNLNTGKVRQLLFGDQKLTYEGIPYRRNSDVLLVESSIGNKDELLWNKGSQLSYYLCFTKTGKLVPVKENLKHFYDIMELTLSPENDFLVYYDTKKQNYLSYEVKTGNTEIISRTLKEELLSPDYCLRSGPGILRVTPGIVGWVKGKKKVIVHGTFDLWELDLANNVPPKNLTNRIGNKNQLIFSNLSTKILDGNEKWLLSAFSMRTKERELYSYNYKTNQLFFLFKTNTFMAESPIDPPRDFKKAARADAYLIKLGNAQVSPNLIYTNDFKKLDTLSQNYPERNYNWLSKELIVYHDQYDKECMGIIYKPENFEPTKKYPVILYYYLESANKLNHTEDVNPSSIGFNIPICVSNEYVVCRPTIYSEANKPGESTLTSVLAAANFLKTLSWVDSTRMGIVGHSRGGYETNYIVTHTDEFKAAVSGAGISNLVEHYNSIFNGDGRDNNNYVRSQMLMTFGLDENPDIYSNNSPIMSAKSMKTPLLLMHNERDESVSVSQSIEFFIQLRTTQRPVWLLQYEDEGHVLSNLEHQIDFQNKVKEFFDYYLKDRAMPSWMNNPIK